MEDITLDPGSDENPIVIATWLVLRGYLVRAHEGEDPDKLMSQLTGDEEGNEWTD